MKMKSTGGAGFSSGQQKSMYDPTDRQSNERRTPRRNLQSIIGAGNQAQPEITRLTGLGASRPQVSVAGDALPPRNTMGGEDKSPGLSAFGAGQAPIKPPLYVPTKRQPS